MEIVAIGLPLIGAAIWIKQRPSEASVCHTLGAYFFARRDGALLRQRKFREYLGAAVPEVQSNG